MAVLVQVSFPDRQMANIIRVFNDVNTLRDGMKIFAYVQLKEGKRMVKDGKSFRFST